MSVKRHIEKTRGGVHWVNPAPRPDVAAAKTQKPNPLVGVWFRYKVEGITPDEGQLFIVRSDGTALVKQCIVGGPADIRWSLDNNMDQPYTLDEKQGVLYYYDVAYKYSLEYKRLTLLRLEAKVEGRVIIQHYFLVTDRL